jgi:DNA repair exonuclease SbcCD ATPase subunit
MPSKKNRRKDANNWEGSGTDDSYSNSFSYNTSNRSNVEEASGRGTSNGKGYINDQTAVGRSYQGKVGSSLQPDYKATLGPWTRVVGETVQSLEETQQMINNLEKIFKSHRNDLESIDETNQKLLQLKEDCIEKDEELDRRESTIRTLTNMGHATRAKIDDEIAKINEQKEQLKQEREKERKRVELQLAEARHKLKEEFDKRTREHDESNEKRMREHDESNEKRMRELEIEFTQKRDENKTKAAAFEAEKERLLTAAKERDKKIEAQAEELENIKEQCDLLVRAKDSIREEKRQREIELKQVKEEFELDPPPIEYLYVF